MSIDEEQPPLTRYEHGRVVQFLRRNYFLVALDDRQIVAAMPERLLPIGAQCRELRPGEWINVKVRLRPRPRMARIVDAYRSCLTG
jgi:hypothetical protein